MSDSTGRLQGIRDRSRPRGRDHRFGARVGLSHPRQNFGIVGRFDHFVPGVGQGRARIVASHRQQHRLGSYFDLFFGLGNRAEGPFSEDPSIEFPLKFASLADHQIEAIFGGNRLVGLEGVGFLPSVDHHSKFVRVHADAHADHHITPENHVIRKQIASNSRQVHHQARRRIQDKGSRQGQFAVGMKMDDRAVLTRLDIHRHQNRSRLKRNGHAIDTEINALGLDCGHIDEGSQRPGVAYRSAALQTGI